MSAGGWKHRLAEALARQAERRLRRDYPEWARAVAAEFESLGARDHPLRWAAGCLGASFRTPRAAGAFTYAALLAVGVAGMIVHQWRADEGAATYAVLAAITILLGMARPDRFVASGLAVGAVVAGVHLFGAISGVQPPYETRQHDVAHSLRWLVLLVPALLTAAIGRHLGLFLRASSGAAS